MDKTRQTAASKFLSYILRHHPEAAGLTLDPAGWAEVEGVLAACGKQGHPLSRAELDDLVATNGKQRFAFSEDGLRMRAQQGHSTPVDLGYRPAEPPDVLFHGTVESLLPAIREKGLLRMERHHVHLSAEVATARVVGARRGRPVVLRIDARSMGEAGHAFFVTPNGVWLTETVPSPYILGLED